MPETSSDRSAPFTARRLPTASTCGCQSCNPAVTVETVCGGLAIDAITCWMMCALKFWNAKNPPSTMPTAINMMTMRLIMSASLRQGRFALSATCATSLRCHQPPPSA